MSRIKKITLCAVVITALLFSNVFPGFASASQATTRYKVLFSDGLYDGLELQVTQFLSTAPEHTTNWSGMSVSKRFSPIEGFVSYDPVSHNYYIEFYPFKPYVDGTKWYEDSSAGPFNSGGHFYYTISIPFQDDKGRLVDYTKLNDNAYIDYIALYINSFILSPGLGYVNKRGFTASIELADGGFVYLYNSSMSDVAPQDFSLVLDTYIRSNQIKRFVFTFGYNGLPSENAVFQFTIDADSYIDVTDYNLYQDGVIADDNQSVDNLKGGFDSASKDLNVSKPSDDVVADIGSNIDYNTVNGFASYGNLYNKLEGTKLYTVLTAMILSTISVAFIGYALHGKR